MFQFPGFASCKQDTLTGGFPHSEIRGSKIALISPRLIAECHVLHRLSTPRHPPNALLALVRSENRHMQGKTPSPPANPGGTREPSATHPHKRSALHMMRSQPAPQSGFPRKFSGGNSGRQDWRGQLYYLIYDVSEPGRPTNAGPIGIAKTYSLTNAVSRAPENPTPKLVEPIGFEPTTSCLQSRRSPD